MPSPIDPLTDTKAYVHDWIETTSLQPKTRLLSSREGDEEADDCLTERLYACCLRILQEICRRLSAIDPDELERTGLDLQRRLLHEELGRLYLCGEGLTSREATTALENADDLRNSLLEILCGIGSLLAHSEYCYILHMLLASCD